MKWSPFVGQPDGVHFKVPQFGLNQSIKNSCLAVFVGLLNVDNANEVVEKNARGFHRFHIGDATR